MKNKVYASAFTIGNDQNPANMKRHPQLPPNAPRTKSAEQDVAETCRFDWRQALIALYVLQGLKNCAGDAKGTTSAEHPPNLPPQNLRIWQVESPQRTLRHSKEPCSRCADNLKVFAIGAFGQFWILELQQTHFSLDTSSPLRPKRANNTINYSN